MHKTRLELWLDFYKAALPGHCIRISGASADVCAAESADLAMARYDALEAKVMAETRAMYCEANQHDGKVKLKDLWGSGTMVRG